MLSAGPKEVYHFVLLIKRNFPMKSYQNTFDVSFFGYHSPSSSSSLLTNSLDTKMTSFQRQLNLYGFRRVTKGEDVGAYYHPKFQKGRRDLISEIKRLPGKSAAYIHDDKNKILPVDHHNRFNPSEGNLVEVIGANNRPVTMSKLTMKIAGINSNAVSYFSPQNSSNSLPSLNYAPAYVTENAVQFLNVPPSSDNNVPHQLPTVCLTRETTVEQSTPPLLLRNFSVSSTFDEEYRLPVGNEELLNDKSTPSLNPNVIAKPPLPVREESESWVKLGVLDQLNDMDPFDIDTVFE